MNERQPNSQEHEDCSGWQRRKTRSVAEIAVTAAVTDVVFQSSERISGQAPSFSIEGQLM